MVDTLVIFLLNVIARRQPRALTFFFCTGANIFQVFRLVVLPAFHFFVSAGQAATIGGLGAIPCFFHFLHFFSFVVLPVTPPLLADQELLYASSSSSLVSLSCHPVLLVLRQTWSFLCIFKFYIIPLSNPQFPMAVGSKAGASLCYFISLLISMFLLQVTLVVPWLSKADQELVYPNKLKFETPAEQEVYVRDWLEQRVGFKTNFKIRFYPGRVSSSCVFLFRPTTIAALPAFVCFPNFLVPYCLKNRRHSEGSILYRGDKWGINV